MMKQERRKWANAKESKGRGPLRRGEEGGGGGALAA